MRIGIAAYHSGYNRKDTAAALEAAGHSGLGACMDGNRGSGVRAGERYRWLLMVCAGL
jgi:hypothetical protein